MLELNKYSTNKIEDLKDFFTVAFVIIDDIYNEIAPTYIRKRRNIKDAILCDSEIITISIVGELLTIDSEKSWFQFVKRNFKDLFPHMCDRTDLIERKNPYPKPSLQLIFKIRRRIETTFSQLTEQLNINTVLAKSL